MHIAITGASTGIGAAVAALLQANGHKVTAFDIVEPNGVDHWIETDLSDPASIDAAVKRAPNGFDTLINNAGLPPREGLTEKVLLVNWFGLNRFLNAMLPKMQSGGAIVNTASRAGGMWRENLDQVKALFQTKHEDVGSFCALHNIDATRAYNLSKEAVIVMTFARTQEMLNRNLRMNCVSPAAVSTGILDDFVNAFGEKVAQNIARAGRAGTPEEVAEVIAFLALPESHWIKGQDITIDGGMSAMAATDMFEIPDIALN